MIFFRSSRIWFEFSLSGFTGKTLQVVKFIFETHLLTAFVVDYLQEEPIDDMTEEEINDLKSKSLSEMTKQEIDKLIEEKRKKRGKKLSIKTINSA